MDIGDNHVPYTRDEDSSILEKAAEVYVASSVLNWALHRMRRHVAAAVIFVLATITAVVSLCFTGYGTNTPMLWVFWSMAATAFASLAKSLS